MTTLLQIRNLSKHFDLRLGAFGERGARVHALDDFSVDIATGETLSIIGESGCGKSTTGFAILNLHRPSGGSVTYKGTDLAQLDEAAIRPFRRDLQIVFQDPYSTLNPRMTIGEALSKPTLFHKLAPAATLFATPLHPYTRALLSAVPQADPRAPRNRQMLQGEVPSPLAPPPGCRFHTRCPLARDLCRSQTPALREITPGHHLACHAVTSPTSTHWEAPL